jgi:hypothetical protein
MLKSVSGLVLVGAICAAGGFAQVQAADMARKRYVPPPSVVSHCEDSDGCWYTHYVRHRVLLSTYGAGFDPNNYDFTEPHYFFGGERDFPRYSWDPG